MIKPILFGILFAIVGLVLFAFLAPLFLHPADPRKLGQIAAPVIVLVFGLARFIWGWRRRKKV